MNVDFSAISFGELGHAATHDIDITARQCTKQSMSNFFFRDYCFATDSHRLGAEIRVDALSRSRIENKFRVFSVKRTKHIHTPNLKMRVFFLVVN